MASVKEKLEASGRALAKLEQLCDLAAPSEVERDAAIKRFEYSFDTIWKAARTHLLLEFAGIDKRSPKDVIRASLQAGLLDPAQTEAVLKMADDRNLTANTYKEEIAKKVYERLYRHSSLLRAWLQAMNDQIVQHRGQ